MAYNEPRKKYNKKNSQQSDDKFLTVGKISLWNVPTDYPSKTTVATGVMDIYLDGDTDDPIKVRVYLHKGVKKNSKSPDYYGFAKSTEVLFSNIVLGDKPSIQNEKEVQEDDQETNESWQEDDDEIPFE